MEFTANDPVENFNDLDTLWADALKIMRGMFSGVIFDTVIKPLKLFAVEDNTFIVKTDENLFKPQLEERHKENIQRALKGLVKRDIAVRIISPEDLEKHTKRPIRGLDHLVTQSNLIPKYVFESFVRGKSNELAYAASLAVSESPGKTTYNPLFLYGGVGLGKTHLMHSIGNAVLSKNQNMKVLYCTTETFTNELINFISANRNEEFRNKYRKLDVLLIDDIQFLSRTEKTQEEFFNTFNALYNANKLIVISSDLPPNSINNLEDRLRSRFSCGLLVDITLPDFETRTAILERKAVYENLVIPKEVTRFIADNIVSNIRELEGALIKVAAHARLTNNEINMELAARILKDIIREGEKKIVTVELVRDTVARYFNISTAEMCGKKRSQSVAYPRQVAMYLSRKLLDVPFIKVGEAFGGRDHSTIIYGCEKIAEDMKNDENVKLTINELEKRILSDNDN